MPLLVSASQMPSRGLVSPAAPPSDPHLSAPASIETLSLLFLVVPALLVFAALAYALYKYGDTSSAPVSPTAADPQLNGHATFPHPHRPSTQHAGPAPSSDDRQDPRRSFSDDDDDDDDEKAHLLALHAASPPHDDSTPPPASQPWRATARVSSTARGTVPSSPPPRPAKHATSRSLSPSLVRPASPPASTVGSRPAVPAGATAKQVVGSKAARAEAAAREKWKHEMSVSVDMEEWERNEARRAYTGGVAASRKDE